MPMDVDVYIPIYTILSFFFYMGLLKVRNGKLESLKIDDITILNRELPITVHSFIEAIFILQPRIVLWFPVYLIP